MCIGNEDGSIGSKHPNPAVPLSLLTEILEWREGGISMDDIVDRLRPRTVPSGYPYCTRLESWLAACDSSYSPTSPMYF